MGDPKKLKKQYQTPNHPWNLTNIEEGKKLRKEYGLRIRKEALIADSFLKKYKDLAKKLIAQKTPQGEKEKSQILTKLQQLGLLSSGADSDDILNLTVEDVLNRRLQSVVFRNNLARSMKQARQFITHRHITVKGKEITAPGYLVSLEEEASLGFKEKSSLASEDHPERTNEAAEIHAEAQIIKPKETKIKESEAEEVDPAESKSAEEIEEVPEVNPEPTPAEKTTEPEVAA